MESNYKHSELTSVIIEAFYEVYSVLGYGFLEKVYENALMIELEDLGLSCQKQKPLEVIYKNQMIGDYYTDIIVEDKVILEIKAVREIIKIHEVQLVNYLKATKMEVGLVLNFGPKPQIKRKVLTNY